MERAANNAGGDLWWQCWWDHDDCEDDDSDEDDDDEDNDDEDNDDDDDEDADDDDTDESDNEGEKDSRLLQGGDAALGLCKVPLSPSFKH